MTRGFKSGNKACHAIVWLFVCQMSNLKSQVSGLKSQVCFAKSLSEAVQAARKLAVKGDVVLLSTACASYDMFENYEQRGDLFSKLVNG